MVHGIFPSQKPHFFVSGQKKSRSYKQSICPVRTHVAWATCHKAALRAVQFPEQHSSEVLLWESRCQWEKIHWQPNIPVIPVFGRLRQEDYHEFGRSLGFHSEFKASIGYSVRNSKDKRQYAHCSYYRHPQKVLEVFQLGGDWFHTHLSQCSRKQGLDSVRRVLALTLLADDIISF